jgi:integrase
VKLFQNSKGNWHVSFVDQTGKHRYLSLKTTEKAVAEQIAAELVPHALSKVRDPIHREVARFVADRSDLRSTNWTRDNGYILHRWASEMLDLDCSCVQEITTLKLQTWFNRKKQTIKTATVAAYLTHVRTFLEWAREERHLLLYNPADKVRVPKFSKAVRRNFLPLPAAQKLIDNCMDEQLRFVLYCGIHAGFRFSEAMMARPEWFDLESKLIHIQVSEEWAPKNGKGRTIPMSDEFHAFLEIYGLRSPYMIAPDKELVGSPRHRYDISRRFDRLTMQCQINCTFHDLRRTFCSLKVSAGVSLYKVAKWAGHGMQVCEAHYAHLVPSDDDNIVLERKTPAPEIQASELSPHRQLTWEELHELVWSMPMTRAARQVGITDNGLRKWCNRIKVPIPPQGYWQVPPTRRAMFLERAHRSHKGAAAIVPSSTMEAA